MKENIDIILEQKKCGASPHFDTLTKGSFSTCKIPA